MRAHGVPNFPDPNSQGKFLFTQGAQGVNPNLSGFHTASQDCKALAPPGQSSAAATTGFLAKAVKFSACMRAHGVPKFPDPTSAGGGMIHVGGPGLDPNSSAFQHASHACQSLAPIGASGGGLSAPPPGG